jgi:hypothetical protein
MRMDAPRLPMLRKLLTRRWRLRVVSKALKCPDSFAIESIGAG